MPLKLIPAYVLFDQQEAVDRTTTQMANEIIRIPFLLGEASLRVSHLNVPHRTSRKRTSAGISVRGHH